MTLYDVREGDNWQSIAQRAGEGIVEATTLAIMNGYPVNEPAESWRSDQDCHSGIAGQGKQR